MQCRLPYAEWTAALSMQLTDQKPTTRIDKQESKWLCPHIAVHIVVAACTRILKFIESRRISIVQNDMHSCQNWWKSFDIGRWPLPQWTCQLCAIVACLHSISFQFQNNHNNKWMSGAVFWFIPCVLRLFGCYLCTCLDYSYNHLSHTNHFVGGFGVYARLASNDKCSYFCFRYNLYIRCILFSLSICYCVQ